MTDLLPHTLVTPVRAPAVVIAHRTYAWPPRPGHPLVVTAHTALVDVIDFYAARAAPLPPTKGTSWTTSTS